MTRHESPEPSARKPSFGGFAAPLARSLVRSWERQPGWWLLALALAVTAAVYSAGLSGTWFFDDNPNIVDNPGVHMHTVNMHTLSRAALSSPSSQFKRPLASLTFAFNYLASGLHPFWWKVTNVLIHLVNGVLLFLLARLLLTLGLPAWHRARADGTPLRGGPSQTLVDRLDRHTSDCHVGILAALVAGGWMLLPINLTAVLYVVQRMASMANAFVLLGLIGYVVSRRNMLADPGRYWRHFGGAVASIVVCMAVGFTAKETAVLLPLYALLIEWVLLGFAGAGITRQTVSGLRGRRLDKPLMGMYVVILLLPLAIGLWWRLPGLFAAHPWPTRDFTPATRLLSEARVVSDYLRWTLLPTPDALSFYHDNFPVSSGLLSPWTTLTSLVFLAALLAAAIGLRKRAPLASLGVLLYFACHTLTATIVPLELVYEHRNYFASIGLMLVVVPLLAAPRQQAPMVDARLPGGPPGTAMARADRPLPMHLPRYVLLGGLLLLWMIQTAMTSYMWGGKLRLAEAMAARNPDSPRAEYQLGRTYLIKSHYNPHSRYTRLAYGPLERAAALPHSSILAEQALIFMNARMHRPIKDAWWDSMIAKLKARDPGVQDESSLGALTQCARDGGCKLPQKRMVAAFHAALDHPHKSARIMAIFGDYAWNVMGDHPLGAHMTAEAVKRKPDEPAYHITLARMRVVQGRYPDARAQIRALERLNYGGRLDGSIAGLRKLLQ